MMKEEMAMSADEPTKPVEPTPEPSPAPPTQPEPHPEKPKTEENPRGGPATVVLPPDQR